MSAHASAAVRKAGSKRTSPVEARLAGQPGLVLLHPFDLAVRDPLVWLLWSTIFTPVKHLFFTDTGVRGDVARGDAKTLHPETGAPHDLRLRLGPCVAHLEGPTARKMLAADRAGGPD
jgi:hypothetical protein